MSTDKRKYLKMAGYTDRQIAELERTERIGKAKSSPLAELVYKAMARPSQPNRIIELVNAKLDTKQTKAAEQGPTLIPHINRMIAGAGRPV